MKLSKEYKPEKACDPSNSRFQLSDARLVGDTLLATSGRLLAVIPVERDESDTDGPISKEALVASRKGLKRGQSAEIIANGDLKIVPQGMTFPRSEPGEWPSCDALLRDEPAESVQNISLDAKLLRDLSEALGSSAVKLPFRGKGRAIKVEACDTDAHGLIMPLVDSTE